MDKVFNTQKTDYTSPSLFFGQPKGLLDTVNKRFPDVWGGYKHIKSLDWDENEFDYKSCNTEFKTCSKSIYDAMLKTIIFQWEADSVAATSVAPILAPFISSSELWAAIQQISTNELTHGFCYSEIVRNSFDNPNEVLEEVLQVEEAMTRLRRVSEVFSQAYTTSHRYALGEIELTQEVYNQVFMVFVALLCLERIQFVASFAVTFAICDTGLFQPIGKAVQKIAQDELEVHAPFDKAVIKYELQTEMGAKAVEMLRPDIIALIDEVVQSELDWVEYLFSGGREILGLTIPLLKKWVLYNAGDVYRFFNIKSEESSIGISIPRDNPLKFMEKWLDISKTQPSPQEQDVNQYRVNILKRTDEDEVFDLDF